MEKKLLYWWSSGQDLMKRTISVGQECRQAGCQIIYGLEGKKHIPNSVRSRGVVRKAQYITQIGTGNYNEKTARLYTDLCLMTVNEQIGMEAARVFQALTKGEIIEEVDHLMVAPKCLQSKVIALIDEEIRHKKQGRRRLYRIETEF